MSNLSTNQRAPKKNNNLILAMSPTETKFTKIGLGVTRDMVNKSSGTHWIELTSCVTRPSLNSGKGIKVHQFKPGLLLPHHKTLMTRKQSHPNITISLYMVLYGMVLQGRADKRPPDPSGMQIYQWTRGKVCNNQWDITQNYSTYTKWRPFNFWMGIKWWVSFHIWSIVHWSFFPHYSLSRQRSRI